MTKSRGPWKLVESAAQLGNYLGLDSDDLPADVLSQLMRVPGSENYLEVRPTISAPDQGFGYLVPHTQYYFNLTASRQFFGDFVVAAIAYTATQSLPVAAGLTAARKVRDNFTILSEDEVELVRVIAGKTRGNPYKQAVEESAVLASYVDAEVDIEALLQALEDKGLIRKRRGGRLQLIL